MSMDIACPSCGASNRPVAKYCKVCRTKLPAIAASAAQITPAQKTILGSPTQLMPTQDVVLILAGGVSLPLDVLNTLGRDGKNNSLSFPQDDRMSRQHAQLELQNGQWLLTDLGSANGTYVNNRRVLNAPVILNSGDMVQLGKQIFTFQIGGILPIAGGSPSVPFAPISVTNWRRWKTSPDVEGYVRVKSERYMVKRDDLASRGFFAVILGVFISPVLAFLPFLQGHDMPAMDLRIEDRMKGKNVDIQIRGELLGTINQGDAVAVWCSKQSSRLIFSSAYNYESDLMIGVKK